MKVFLTGSRRFGAEVLALLRSRRLDVLGVAAPGGNGHADRLSDAARRHGIPLMAPHALSAETLPDGTDLIVAAHSHSFVGARTRDKAALGAIGYHPSLLPRHRGRDAIRWTLHVGDAITGGTVYWLSETVDGGDIAAQDWCFVPPGVAARELWEDSLLPMGLRLLDRTLTDIEGGLIRRVPQDAAFATWEPAFGAAPLPRPDLLQIGQLPEGYRVERH